MNDDLEGPDPSPTSDSSEASDDPSLRSGGRIRSPLPGRPPQAVGFLLSQLGFETSHRFHELMSKVELDPRQFAVMRAIDASDGQSQNAVGEWLRIPPSSMVAVLDRLEARGLVERHLHPSDRRARTLHITGEGQKVLEDAREQAMILEQIICDGFSPNQRKKLLDMLGHIADNLGLVQGLHPGMSADHVPGTEPTKQ
ncbi:MAG: MarR family winged helix-turn-helix transcriptional regulator [Acidimicrobiales bacterium]